MEIKDGTPHSVDLPKVLLLGPPPVYTRLEHEFSQHFHFLKAYTSPLPLPAFLAAANSAGITAMMASGHISINAADVLDHIPSLRCIVITAAGLNQIDLAECRRRGIAVSSAGEAYSDDCADVALALLFDVLRKVSSADRFVRGGRWIQGHYSLGHRMENVVKTHVEDLPKVLLLSPLHVCTLFKAELSQHFHFIKSYESPLPLPHSLGAGSSAGVTAMLISGNIPITAGDILDHLPSLRCIVTITAGLNHIDLSECSCRGIAVASAADVYSDDCADFAVALLINVCRKVSCGDRFVRRGDWRGEGLYCLGHRLSGKKIGIVGLGSIGCRIAKRLEAFGCSILYTSKKEKPSVSYTFYSDVGKLATDSDVLVISCALTDQTRHMINKEVLSALGKEGVIVNIARGPIIDEKELVRFLAEGKIAGAGLDVFEEEPTVPKELLAMDNVVLSPHAAYLTHESFRDVFELVKGNLLAFFSNKPLLSPVMAE